MTQIIDSPLDAAFILAIAGICWIMSRILIASLNQDSIDTPEQIERAAEQFALDISREDLQQIIDLTRAEGSTSAAPAAIHEDL